jgi:Flp pilus assembly protein TadD
MLMHKNFTTYFLSFILLSLILSSCSSGIKNNQIQFGILAAQKGLWDEAVFRWKKVVQTNPDSAAAHNNLAVAYENSGQWDKAKIEYETALKLSPNNSHIKANVENFKKNTEGQEKDKKDEKK